MTNRADMLSPRQRACLQLVWEKQATSKEIAAELGISKSTVDGYISDAVVLLGARDRRDAAALMHAGETRAESGGDAARVANDERMDAPIVTSMHADAASRPWRTPARPRNTLSLAQTIMWIAAVAIGSIVALSLAVSVGDGLPHVAMPTIHAVQRLTH